jgi:hypothetical protein
MGVETSIVPERMLEGSVSVREPAPDIAGNEALAAAPCSMVSADQLGLPRSTVAANGEGVAVFVGADSSRSGPVFNAPEEIRAANLRGAVLRKAPIFQADFYLLDVREALYTPNQEQHLRGCRAIFGD